MAKQSIADRLLRLSEGRCPIHGIPMMPVDGWYWSDTGESIHYSKGWEGRISYSIAKCERRDCNITAITYGLNGPCELTDEWKYLVQGTDNVIPFPNRKQANKEY